MANDEEIVLVTGATGFLALHLIKLLQKEGYRVRGTVRSLKNESKLRPLKNLCPDSKYPLDLVEADLTCDDGWEGAVKGCKYVMHVASPFPNGPPRHEEELLKPAVEGTTRVLKACAEAGTVKRVVLTSSISAVHGESDVEEGRVYTEEDWSDVESPTLDAYGKSKTLAERAAWDFVKNVPESKRFELAVLNPGLVLGPLLDGPLGTSVELIKRLMDHSIPLIPRVNFCLCDARDVALAHLRAMTVPEAAGHRHLICSQHLWMRDIAYILLEEFGPQGYGISTWPAPFIPLWLYSFFDKTTRLILPRVNKEYVYSNKRMVDVLGLTPQSIKTSVTDTAYDLIETGILKKSKHYKSKKEKDEKVTEGE